MLNNILIVTPMPMLFKLLQRPILLSGDSDMYW